MPKAKKRKPLYVSKATKAKLISNKHMKWRQKASKDQGGRCYYCYVGFYEGSFHRRTTLDHFYPVALGGRDHWENVVAACHRCNDKKGELHPQDFPAHETFREDYERRLARLSVELLAGALEEIGGRDPLADLPTVVGVTTAVPGLDDHALAEV